MEKDANNSADSFLDELANENKDYKTPRFNDPLFNRGAKFLLFLFLRRILSFTIDKILILILFFVVMSIWFGPYNWAEPLGYASGSITMNFNEVLFAKDHGSYILYLSFLNSVSFLTVFIVVGRIYYFLCEITFKRSLGKIIFKLRYEKESAIPSKSDFAFKNLFYLLPYFATYSIYFNVEFLWSIELWYCIIFVNILQYGTILIYRVTLYELLTEQIVTYRIKQKKNGF